MFSCMITSRMLCVLSVLFNIGFFVTYVIAEDNFALVNSARKNGFSIKMHEVVTQDGYILNLQRMTLGKPDPNKTPIFLMHSLFGSSDEYLILGPDKGLPFLLAKKGYDVWMGNERGTYNSRKHLKYDADQDKDYWMFTLHEIAIYDLPAMIDHVLNVTRKVDLIYLGHSQGTTLFFIMASVLPEYQEKIRLSICMGPSVFVNNSRSQFSKLMAPHSNRLRHIMDSLHLYEFKLVLENEDLRKMMPLICQIDLTFCEELMEFLGGGFYIDKSLLPVIFTYSPAGQSVMQCLHYLQFFSTGKFETFDYGPKENLVRYGTKYPLKYSLNITIPVALFYSDDDPVTTAKDIKRLANILPNVIELYKVPIINFGHFDFIVGRNAPTLLYFKVMDFIDQYGQ